MRPEADGRIRELDGAFPLHGMHGQAEPQAKNLLGLSGNHSWVHRRACGSTDGEKKSGGVGRMTYKEAAKIIEVATAEVEWEYPMEYAAAFEKAIEALNKCERIASIIDSYDADFVANYVRGLFAEAEE